MNHIKPTVSVIIPTYNRAHLLRRAVQSVLNQSYKELEIIIVDDASIDTTPELVKGIDDERIVYLRHESNKGGSAARNTGIKHARGNYICFLDDDDFWLPKKLEKQHEMFEQSPDSVGILYCGCRIISEKQNKIIEDVYPEFRGQVFSNLLSSCFICSPTVMVRKTIIDETDGFDENLKSLQDWDMWLSLAKLCHADFVDEILAYYYIHSADRISFNILSKIDGKKMFMEKWKDDLSIYPKVLASQYNGLSKFYHIVEAVNVAKEYNMKALQLDPFKLNYYTLMLLIYVAPSYCRKLLKNRFYKY